jgi:hypothetical protein
MLVVRPPKCYVEEAYGLLKEYYKNHCMELDMSKQQQTIDLVGAMKAMLFQHAMNDKLEAAMQALREEVQKALKINIWRPVHGDDWTWKKRNLLYQ